jgi:mevalonate pyrophosphate decarboxylase
MRVRSRFGWRRRRSSAGTPAIVADILHNRFDERVVSGMAKTKEKPALAAEALRPYVKRAMEDPELREDLLAAFVAARSLYGQIAKGEGVKGKAEKVSDKDFQKELQELVTEVSDATDRLREGAKGHKTRNRVILLTGVTLGVLYNPWTGHATREWIMNRVSGNGDFEEFADEFSSETGNGSEPTDES